MLRYFVIISLYSSSAIAATAKSVECHNVALDTNASKYEKQIYNLFEQKSCGTRDGLSNLRFNKKQTKASNDISTSLWYAGVYANGKRYSSSLNIVQNGDNNNIVSLNYSIKSDDVNPNSTDGINVNASIQFSRSGNYIGTSLSLYPAGKREMRYSCGMFRNDYIYQETITTESPYKKVNFTPADKKKCVMNNEIPVLPKNLAAKDIYRLMLNMELNMFHQSPEGYQWNAQFNDVIQSIQNVRKDSYIAREIVSRIIEK